MPSSSEPCTPTLLAIEGHEADLCLWALALEEHNSPAHLVALTRSTAALDYLHGCGEYARMPFPDLVLLDLYLHDGSGLDVVAAIRASSNERVRRVPVVMITDFITPRERAEAERLEVAAVLIRGTCLDDLLALVAEIESRWLVAGQSRVLSPVGRDGPTPLAIDRASTTVS